MLEKGVQQRLDLDGWMLFNKFKGGNEIKVDVPQQIAQKKKKVW